MEKNLCGLTLNTKQRRLLKTGALVGLAIVVVLAFGNRVVVRNVAANPGFESGTNGWYAHDGFGVLAATTDAVHSGRQAVAVTRRSAQWSGPEQSLRNRLTPGQTYVCSGWVRVRNGEEEPVKMSIRQRDGKGRRYHDISTTTASADKWRFFSGRFDFTAAGPLQELILYFEGPGRGVDLLVDDVKIVPDRFLLLLRPVGGALIVLAGVALFGLATRRNRWTARFGLAAVVLTLGIVASWLVDHRSAVVVGPPPDYAKTFAPLGFEKVERGTLLEIKQNIEEPTLYQGTGVRIYGNSSTNLAIVAKTAEIYGRVQGKVYFRGEKITIMKNAEVAGGVDSSVQVVNHGKVGIGSRGQVVTHGALRKDAGSTDMAAQGFRAGGEGDWHQAFVCYQQTDIGSSTIFRASYVTAAALAAGETNACLELCQGVMDRFGDKKDRTTAEQCARICLSVPWVSGALLEKACERADFAVSPDAGNHWRQLAKGMAEYRRGNWADARAVLDRPERSSNLEISSLAWCFGAMARQQLGETASARKALAEVNRRLKVVIDTGELSEIQFKSWDNFARAFAVRVEAARLIVGEEITTAVAPNAVANGRWQWQPIIHLLQAGEQLAAHKQWEEASRIYAQALQQPGFAWDFWELKQTIPAQWLPAAALLAGDETNYVALCRMLLQRTNATLAMPVMQGYAGVCLARTSLLPADLKDRALALARQTCQSPEAAGTPWVPLFRGMIDYRENRYKDTLVSLEGAEAIGPPVTRARALAFRGMAQFRLGQVQEAKQALKQAELASSAGPTGETGWWGVGLCQAAIEELRALLEERK